MKNESSENRIESQYSKELKDLFEADQEDRSVDIDDENFTIEEFSKRDEIRLSRAKEIYLEYKNGQVKLTPEDLYFLAFLFHHSPAKHEGDQFSPYIENPDNKIAYELAKESMDQGYESAKWLMAAAQDRYLKVQNKKQVWGTQFDDTNNEWKHHPELEDDEVSGITDEIRIAHNVLPRAEQLKAIQEKYKK